MVQREPDTVAEPNLVIDPAQVIPDNRLPDAELLSDFTVVEPLCNQLYDAKDKGALKGTFNVTGSDSASWYWSSCGDGCLAWTQRFSDAYQLYYYKDLDSSLRCVR